MEMVRSERFELPTFWFVEDGSRTINNLHRATRSGMARHNLLQFNTLLIFVAAFCRSVPFAARQDFGHG